MVFGPKAQRDCVMQAIVSQGLQCTHEARNLGVIFDLDLNFSKQQQIFKSGILPRLENCFHSTMLKLSFMLLPPAT